MKKPFLSAVTILLMLFWLNPIFSRASESKPSLYDLKTNWRNTKNEKVSIDIARGSLTLIAMVYTSCAHACPMTISKVQDIQKDLLAAGFKNIKVVLASFDAKNDRPERLKKYQEARKLAQDQWIFLSPESESDARQLAVTLGISYKDLGNGDFSHSNIIALLDKNGIQLASIDNLNSSADVFVSAMKSKEENSK
ncbi:MAG: SCO family protein [Bdellovibrionaceae bacterium]|nr:SCO family protein [Pseudobdellovibrionaceae bacterium]